ncbi:MAG: transporter substrate-binding domain-containing protein [Pseudomonadota bacterium]
MRSFRLSLPIARYCLAIVILGSLATALVAPAPLLWAQNQPTQDQLAQDQLVQDELQQSQSEGEQDSSPSDTIRQGLGAIRFINPRGRIAIPEPLPGPVLRFVVSDDFPPFAFVDGAGRLAGAHIDLIRAVCATLELPCTLQARRFDQVLAAADEDPDSLVLAAGLAVTTELARRFSFSLPYYRFAARFVGLQGEALQPTQRVLRDGGSGVTVGVVSGSAHEAFVEDAYPEAQIVALDELETAYAALRNDELDLVFADGIDLALWLGGNAADKCCAFVGAPIFATQYFGEGLAFAVPSGQPRLVQALNAALSRLESSGALETIFLTALPLDPLGL